MIDIDWLISFTHCVGKKATINIDVQVSLLWKIEFFGYIFRSIVVGPYGKGGML